MATNPMQKKARNSFLLGMLLTLLIVGVIGAAIAMMYLTQPEEEEVDPMIKVITLNKNVNSGQIITSDMLTVNEVPESTVPKNATADFDVFENYALRDVGGNLISTRYIDEESDELELYTKIDGIEYSIKIEDTSGRYYINEISKQVIDERNVETNEADDGSEELYTMVGNEEVEVFTEEVDGEEVFYINVEGEKLYMNLEEVPLVAKVDMDKNTVLTTELVTKGDNIVQDDVRREQYNVVELPVDLETGDYIDIRLMLPSGQNFIVVSKKEVEIPEVEGVPSATTMYVNLSEDEILHMSSAIIEYYWIAGSRLYATEYTDPGMQEAATVTYPVNAYVNNLIQQNPNILTSVKQEITSGLLAGIRNTEINTYLTDFDEGLTNIESGILESIQNSIDTREDYLEDLAQ